MNASGRSSQTPSRGQNSVAATTNRSAIATFRRRSCGSPSAESNAAAVSVNSVKLATSPAMIANGRPRPPVAPPARMTGSTGSTQGDRR